MTVTGLYTHYAILFIIILDCILSTYEEKILVKQYVMLPQWQPHASPVY